MMDYSGKAITDTYPTRALCGRRLDNGAPFASSGAGLPRTCLEDVVLVPLASWLFYVALVGAFAYAVVARRRRVRQDNGWGALHPLIYRAHSTANKRRTKTFFAILYSLLILATLLMNVLEIVRLYLADRGAGLLPFTLASLLLVLVLIHTPLSARFQRPLSIAILVFFVFSLIFTSVQLATLTHLQTIEPRANTEYLDSDQIIDVAVIVGLYGLEVLVESARVFTLLRRRTDANEEQAQLKE